MLSLIASCLHFKKSLDDKEEDNNHQHAGGLVEVDSAWEGDEAVLVYGGKNRRSRDHGDSLKAAHECVDLDQSDKH